MEELRKQTWAKVVAMLLAIISGFVLAVTAVAAVLFGTVPEMQIKQSELEKAMQKQLLEGYGNYLLQDSGAFADQMSSDGSQETQNNIDWSSLDGGNIRYSVVLESTDGSEKKILYTNDASFDTDSALTTVKVPAQSYVENKIMQPSMWSLLFGYANQDWYWTEQWRTRQVQKIVYDKEDGMFYGQGATGNYYTMNTFYCYGTGETASDMSDDSFSREEGENGEAYYTQDTTGKRLDEKTIELWMKQNNVLLFDSYEASFQDAGLSIIETVDRIPDEKKLVLEKEYHLHRDGTFEYDATSLKGKQIEEYTVYLSVMDPLIKKTTLKNGTKDYLNTVHPLISCFCVFRQTSGIWVVISAMIFLACLVFLMQAAGRRKTDDEIHLTWVDKIPYGILLCMVGLIDMGCIALVMLCMDAFISMYITLGFGVALMLLLTAAAEYLVLLVLTSTAVRVKMKKFWYYTVCHQICRPFHWLVAKIRENTALSVRVGTAVMVLTLLQLFVIGATDYDTGVEISLFFLYKLVEIPFVFKIAFQLKKIFDAGNRMVQGDYSQPINTKKMIGSFKTHADHLNNLGQGISRAVDEQMKSERFKTELITNVSHDIKTPLTSIINYVDLMEKEEIDNPKVQEYLEVLDRQSARLKKLIEDLMEASKASTGNIKVELEECDATVMLTQVVGEFEDRAKKNDLDIVVSSPEPPANIMADGRHLWRVIDNLMSNICKYAQPGTRVYIDLEKYNGMVIMTFRNTSRYQLNISSEELMERFVRGDSSRNTEGSGLGLSIAQSLTALMGGNFAIQIDGDLFKAILSFDECE